MIPVMWDHFNQLKKAGLLKTAMEPAIIATGQGTLEPGKTTRSKARVRLILLTS